jgi:hypothetical protein
VLNFDLQPIKPNQDIQACSSLASAGVALAVRSLGGGVAAPSAGAVLGVALVVFSITESSDDHHHYPYYPYVPFSRLRELSRPRRFLGITP